MTSARGRTSGLVRYEFQERFTSELARQPGKVWRPEELVSYVLDMQPPFTPGQSWEYPDTNYIVLGMIMEKATGTPYLDLLRGRIPGPLGLADTLPVESRVVPGLVQGYAGPGNPFGGTDAMIADGKFAFNPQVEWTGGGVVSTAADLARWAKALYEGWAFDPSLLPAMLDGVPANLGPGSEYGLGVIIRPTPPRQKLRPQRLFPGLPDRDDVLPPAQDRRRGPGQHERRAGRGQVHDPGRARPGRDRRGGRKREDRPYLTAA